MSDLIGLYPRASGTVDGAPQAWVANTNDSEVTVITPGYFDDKAGIVRINDTINITTSESTTPLLLIGRIFNSGTPQEPELTFGAPPDNTNIAFRKGIISQEVRFDLPSTLPLYFNAPGSLNKVRGLVRIQLGAAAGLIQLKDSEGNDMANGLMTFPSGAVPTDEEVVNPTTNNIIANDGDKIQITSSGAASTGRVVLYFEYTSTPE